MWQMKIKNWWKKGLLIVLALLCSGQMAWADRAVEIARQARDRVEYSGKSLQSASQTLFSEFAQTTVELQRLIDVRQNLEASGLLAKGDVDGDARRAHNNGKILLEVSELKEVCDTNLTTMLTALEQFDQAVADSLVDSQATRSINSNYELALYQYLKQGKTHYQDAAADAESALQSYQAETDERVKSRLLKRYQRAKKRLIQINQRRNLYEARLKVAAVNQQVSGVVRQRIREQGNDIPSRFREVMAGIYNTFAKITPIAEFGGTGNPEVLGAIGFENLGELRSTLDVVDGAIGKLGSVLDDMVTDVTGALSGIQVIDGNGSTSGTLSVEEEMGFLRQQREAWNQ